MDILMQLLLPLIFQLSTSVSSHIETSYTAAVVEYHPIGGRRDNASFVLNANVAEYETFIERAKMQGADIVVFPEYGLTGLQASNSRNLAVQFAQTVPSAPMPQETAEVPCMSQSSSSAIRQLSCSSRKNKIYVVVNLPEMVLCNENDQDCPEDGFYIYNTNVAFDRDGGVISKYHKYNLFMEPSMNKAKEPMYSTFNTDFGVTFGMFICFDILFKEPAFNLVKMKNVKDVIYSTAWISQLPFLTAVQTQESWSFGLDVNLIASGFNLPESGKGGSGIYAGRKGSLISKMPSTSGSHLLITQVPITSNNDQMQMVEITPQDTELNFLDTTLECQITDLTATKHMFLIHDNLSNYTFSEVLGNGLNDIELCSGNLCCNFHADVQLSDDGHEAPIYRFAVTDSQIKYANTYRADIQVCGLLYCKGDNIKECVYYPDNPQILNSISFKSIRISGNFSSSQLILPSTLITSLEPLPASSLNFMVDENKITLESTKNSQDLLTFSIYVRNFDATTSFKHEHDYHEQNDDFLENMLKK